MKKEKKNYIFIICVVIIGIILMFINNNYAETKSKNKVWFLINSEEIYVGDKVLMQCKVNQIGYTNYKLTISSDHLLVDVPQIDDTWIDTTQMKQQKVNNTLEVWDIADNINSLKLSYSLKDEIPAGTKIKFIITITNTDDTTEQMTEVIEIEIKEKQEENKDQNNMNNTIDGNNQIKEENNMQSDKTAGQESNNMTGSNRGVSGGMSVSGSSGTTYAGESNNYLSSLTVSGYTLSPDFDKTNQTYFMDVPYEQTSLTMNAQKDSSNSTVSVFGQTNLSVGKNKIIIAVKAQNGEIRNYRIYVTRKDR